MTTALLVVVLAFVSNSYCELQDGGKAPRIQLNDGNSIPHLGLGTFLGFDENGQKPVRDNDTEVPVSLALSAGYRSDSEFEYNNVVVCEPPSQQRGKKSSASTSGASTTSKRKTAAERKAEVEVAAEYPRLFDTAQAYKNEEQVGRAIRASAVPRENIFIVTKLGLSKQRRPVEALRDSLRLMNTSYVDLYLIHNPVALTPDESAFDIVDYVDTWREMERSRALGLARSIGVSNFNVSQLERLITNSEIVPAVLQVEVNLNLAQSKLIEFCKKHEIVVMAYTPFGGLFDKDPAVPPPKVDDPTMVAIAKKYEKTTPQIALRYLLQRGVVPIPKSVRKEKIQENIDVFDFELTEQEMTTLAAFNKDHRTVWPSFWQEHPYYPFERKDKPDPDIFRRNLQKNN